MVLWTIRSSIELRAFESTETLLTDDSFIDKDYIGSYDWMANKLLDKVSKPSNHIKYPIWLWKCWDKERSCRPDLRVRWGKKSEELVLLKVNIPDSLVLLSEYHLWHYVLNKWYLPKDIKDYKNYTNLSFSNKNFTQLSNKEKKIIIDSWNNIFNWNTLDKTFHGNSLGSSIQAVCWEIKKEWILDTKYFISK